MKPDPLNEPLAEFLSRHGNSLRQARNLGNWENYGCPPPPYTVTALTDLSITQVTSTPAPNLETIIPVISFQELCLAAGVHARAAQPGIKALTPLKSVARSTCTA